MRTPFPRMVDYAKPFYKSGNRPYHNWQHIEVCLSALAAYAWTASTRDRQLMNAAIIFHDIMQSPGNPLNEDESADVAAAYLDSQGEDKGDVAEVHRLILLTRHHIVSDEDSIGAAVVSADLSILGSHWDVYRQYVANIQKEYSAVPEKAFVRARAKFLANYLGRWRLYPNECFHAHFGRQARDNMSLELAQLIDML